MSSKAHQFFKDYQVVMRSGPATTYLPIVINTLEALQGQK